MAWVFSRPGRTARRDGDVPPAAAATPGGTRCAGGAGPRLARRAPRARVAAVLVASAAVLAVTAGAVAVPAVAAAAGGGFVNPASGSAAAQFRTTVPVNCNATPWRCGIVLGTWQRIVDPTYSGPGTNPIILSACAAGGCQFNTGGGGRTNGGFVLVMPAGLVAKVQGGSGYVEDDMATIKAMLALNPRQWAPNTFTGVEASFTVSPGYASKLRAAGISPAAFLAWMLSGFNGGVIRSSWHCGLFGCRTDGFDTGNYTTLPAGERGGIPRRVSHGVGTAAKAVAQAAGATLSAAGHLVAGKVTADPKAGARGRASRTASAGIVTPAESASGPGALVGRTLAVGAAAPDPRLCGPGMALIREPTGARCLPDVVAGVHPGLRWWEWALALTGGVLLLGLAGGVRAHRRSRAAAWRPREEPW